MIQRASIFISIATLLFCTNIDAGTFAITSLSGTNVNWSGTYNNGICTIETSTTLTNGNATVWMPLNNYYTSNSVGQAPLPVNATNCYFRLLAVNIAASSSTAYTNFLQSYGNLQTIAGSGKNSTDGVNNWLSSYEGSYATNVTLSRPHNALGDLSGNVLIVDKWSHSVLKVTPDGRIYTFAGTHVGGDLGDGPASARSLRLNAPNGLFINLTSGIVYIMDTGNGKIRRVDTNGIMKTVFSVSGGISQGRGLWVNDTETLAFFGDETTLKMWDPINGVTVLNSKFTELGNITVTGKGNVIATDRGDNTVWKVDATGKSVGDRSKKYGSGKTLAFVDGTSAVTNSLYGVRGVWPLPIDGYLLALHEGCQIIYVDSNDIGHILLNGIVNAHAGDGQWFYSSTSKYKVSEARSVTMDPQGNILIVESDNGYVRRIDFKRLNP